VNTHGFTIDFPYCFLGGYFYGGAVATKTAYYGSLITAATATTITLAAATNVPLTAGQSITLQRLRYAPPNTDTDPGHAAFTRYATFLANQIAAAGAQGYVEIWNEYAWDADRWETLGAFYDTPPASTLTICMKQILTLCQQASLPAGVSFVNGVSGKTGQAGVAVQGISVPGAISYDAIHPYGDNPEWSAWDYYAWGFYNDRTPPASLTGYTENWWAVVNPADQGGNFRNMAFVNDLTPGAPALMATECGYGGTNDTAQAKSLVRRVAALWGMGVPSCNWFDDGSAVGSDTMCVAPSSTPRASYYALQRMTQVIGRMTTTGPVGATAPSVIGWPTDTWALMTSTTLGDTGHAVIFLWQRTARDTDWASVPTPATVSATITIPAGPGIAEALNVRTGAAVTTTTNGNALSVPVSDDVIAVRFAPA